MCIVRFVRSAEGVALCLLGVLCPGGCLVADASGVADVRGVSRGGWVASVGRPRDPTLTEAGKRVRVEKSGAKCRFLGLVSGKAGRDADKPALAVSVAVLEREAVQDARNLAGAEGADRIVIDARERWRFPRTARTYAKLRVSAVLVHGRAFRCVATATPPPRR